MIAEQIIKIKEINQIQSHKPTPTPTPNFNFSKQLIQSGLQQLNTNMNKKTYNLTAQQQLALLSLKNNKNIVIKPADKNIGTTIIERETYIQLANEHLTDKKTYKKLPTDPLETTLIQIKSLIHNLCDNKLINTTTHNQLLPPHPSRTGYFYILPKLHKKQLSSRPIISQINHPTSNLSNYLHDILKDTATQAKTHIPNSLNLKHLLENISLPENNTILFTADITSLYTNIPTNDGIEKTTKMYQAHTPQQQQINETALRSILYNTLTQNIFTFNDQHYRQIHGTAMGTIMAPTYANCYLRYLEEIEKPLNNPNLILHLRYIDDILGIYDNQNNDFNNFLTSLTSTYLPLTLNVEHSNESINFLDLTITIDKINKKLKTKLYQKPEKTKPLIRADSNHPQHTLTNILTNELYRRTSLCSHNSDKLAETTKLIQESIKQKYPTRRWRQIKYKVIKRLQTNNKTNKPNKKRLILTYNKYSLNLTKHLKQQWKNKKPKELPISPLRISYRHQNNLKKQLIRAKLPTTTEQQLNSNST
jgi:hypothetical protein